MEEDWIFLGDGAGGSSDTDSASDDDDSGFTIVRRGRKGGDHSRVVVRDDAPAQPRVAAVAVPQPTPPGLSFRVVSYGEAFSDGGGRREHPGCNDEATAGEAIAIQGAGIDDAAATGSTDCGVTCKEGCESDGSAQVGKHDVEASSAPSVAVAAAPTVNCLEATAVLHSEVHPELASVMDQGGAEEIEGEDSERCEDEEDEHTENFDEEEEEYTAEISSEEEYTVEICSEEEVDAESCGEEESSHVVDVADIFAMLLPRATTACDANAEQGAANADGAVKEPSGSFHDDIDNDSSDTEDDCSGSDEEDGIADVAENGNQDIFDMLLPRERTIDDEEEAAMTADIFRMLFPRATACGANIGDSEDGSEHRYIDYEAEFGMLLPRECAIHADIVSSDGGEEAATATADIFHMLFPGARACDDDVDDTCDVPGTSAQSGGPAEALFTVRGRERALAIEEVRRREAAQQELDHALAREAAAAAEALEWDVLGCPTAKRQATGVTQPAVAELDALADFTFIVGVYVFVYLAVSLFFSSVVR